MTGVVKRYLATQCKRIEISAEDKEVARGIGKVGGKEDVAARVTKRDVTTRWSRHQTKHRNGHCHRYHTMLHT